MYLEVMWYSRKFYIGAFACLVSFLGVSDEVLLNQVQVIGTHNSYHLELHPTIHNLIMQSNASEADGLDYSHRPIPYQLEFLGARSLELDLYADPEGGHYAAPKTRTLAEMKGMPIPPQPPLKVMSEPGFKIIHMLDVDYYGTVFSLKQALEQVVQWSENHPAHVPVFILLELKNSGLGAGFTEPVAWSDEVMRDLEAEILTHVPAGKIITPGKVKGDYASLREAVTLGGWPSLSKSRGKVMFCLDNAGSMRDLYREATSELENSRLLFTSMEEDSPDAAWFKINDPVGSQDRIQRLVREGFMVRTRADSDTQEARTGDSSRLDLALSSGAQFISSDFLEPRLAWSSYSARLPEGQVARPNPISAPNLPSEIDLEELAHAALTGFSVDEMSALYREGVDLHLGRRLDEASACYARVLELDPAQCPTQRQLLAMQILTPELRVVPGEPFQLQDLVAIHHPERPLIAYHLFWEDDIDFPEDNDPTDHEVVWVEYDMDTGYPTYLYSYFHGNIVTTPADPNHQFTAFAVEWGKHGSLPFCCGTAKLPDEHERLLPNWKQLHDRGIRRPDSAFAKDWPKKFVGSYEEYIAFDLNSPIRWPVGRSIQYFCSKWSSAVLDQLALDYNFRPKPSWPDGELR